MEHVIRYRILGHHPAASGKYYNTGFSGEFLLVRQLLDEVVKEHQINLSAFKAVIALVTSANNGGGGYNDGNQRVGGYAGEAGGSAGLSTAAATTSSTILYLDDHLHNYDSVDITVSKRSLADDAEAAEEERKAQAQSRLKAAEEQFHLLDGDAHAWGSRAGAAGGGGAARGPPAQHSANGRLGATGASAFPASSVDAMALQRAMALASKFFPVRAGQTSSLDSAADAKNDHVCVLCELPAFREVFTRCCYFPVCKTCQESGQAMMMNEDECPVCGRNTRAESESPAHRQKRDQPLGKVVKKETQHSARAEEKLSVSSAADGVSGVKRLHGSEVSEEGERRRGRPSQQSTMQGRRLEVYRHSGKPTPHSSLSSRFRMSGEIEDDRVHSPAVLRVEEELRESLDRTLSFLDAPDPLTAEMKAKRRKSAALAALDAAE